MFPTSAPPLDAAARNPAHRHQFEMRCARNSACARLGFAKHLRDEAANTRLAGIMISLAMLIADSEARDRGQFAKSTPEMQEWFNNLKSGKGFLCCSDADGTAVSDVDWESKDGHYRVRLGGQWIDVPDDALVTVPNRAGRTMVWPMPMIEGDTIKIRCFMPGSMI
jgi:hypothetical protein